MRAYPCRANPAVFARTHSKDSMGVSLSTLHQSVHTLHRSLDAPWLCFPHRRDSAHWPRFGPLPPQPFLKPSSKRPSSVTGANIHWSSTPMTNCPLFSASRKRARASPDMLSGPERFLKHVGPQMAYLPIRLAYRPHWRCTACHAEVDPCFDAIRVLGKQILLVMFMSSGPSSNPSQVQLRRTGAEKHLRSSTVRKHHCPL